MTTRLLLDLPGHADVTDSVSSPGATGVGAPAIGAAILARNTAAGRAFLGDAQGRAERDAGGLGINLGLAARIGDRLRARLVEQLSRPATP